MKKTIILSVLATVAFAGASFAQGFIFQTTKGAGVYFTPQYTNGATLGNNTLTVGFLWASSGTPLVGTSGIATNTTSANVPASDTWANILNETTFTWATKNSTLVTVAVNNSGVGQAGWSYNGGLAFHVDGTTDGNTYEVFTVAWNSAYSTPQAAAAAGSYLGVSKVFNYTSSASSSVAPPTFGAAGLTSFGVVGPVPEPGTLALAGMGIASLLAFRRRNSK